MRLAFSGADVFDGTQLHQGVSLIVENGQVAAIAAAVPDDARVTRLDGGIIAPGLIDLQVNGGGGRMVGRETTVDDLAAICAAHLSLGATGVLPTLITDTPAATETVVAAGIAAARQGVPGFLGLHLEGPHLDPRRKGAHDPALIRPMTDDDLARLVAAAQGLPRLMVTLGPESATLDQVRALALAGVIVSLGHSDCSHDDARAAIAAGASCVTHLFNAMSQLGNREPGLVGAALDSTVHAGLIADGIHVRAEVMRIALAAKPEGLFLVSDSMAVAGTNLRELALGSRRIFRNDGRLTLADGTLAGADLSLPQAISVLVTRVGVPPARALAMATSVPATVIGLGDRIGHLLPGRPADMVHLTKDWRLAAVWRAGVAV